MNRDEAITQIIRDGRAAVEDLVAVRGAHHVALVKLLTVAAQLRKVLSPIQWVSLEGAVTATVLASGVNVKLVLEDADKMSALLSADAERILQLTRGAD